VVGFDGLPWTFGIEAFGRLERRDLDGLRQWLDWAHASLVEASREDATQLHPFARFWEPGQEANSDDFELAAALLVAAGPGAAIAQPILRDVEVSTHDALEREVAQEALLWAYAELEEKEHGSELAAKMLRGGAASSAAFGSAAAYLLESGSAEAARSARALAEERLREHPGDVAASRVMARASVAVGDAASAQASLAALRAAGAETLDDLALRARLVLRGTQGVAQEEVEMLRARALAARKKGAELGRWVAVLLTERGAAHDAVEVLRAIGEGFVSPEGAYVEGRILEDLGFVDTARARYARAEAAAPEVAGLARERTRKLPRR